MRAIGLLFGFVLTLLGGAWTYQGWIAPRAGDGFGQLVPWLLGPPAFLFGLILLGACYPYDRSPDGDDKSSTNKDVK